MDIIDEWGLSTSGKKQALILRILADEYPDKYPAIAQANEVTVLIY